MPNPAWKVCRGPIRELRLSQYAWRMLDDEKITTIDQLTAVADQIEQLVPGIGPKMAAAIRAELARVAAPERQSHAKRQASGRSLDA